MLKPLAPTFATVQLGLLDNDEFSISLVRTTAGNCGMRRLAVFAEPEDAVAALRRSSKPEIMLVHHKPLDGMGFEFCRIVRDRKLSPDPFLPIIMISGHVTRQDVIEARDAGVDEFLATPFSPKSFARRVSSILNNRRGFVDIDGYFGPDRRRGAIAEMLGDCRRTAPIELIDANTGRTYMG